jgi:hypothetical protein
MRRLAAHLAPAVRLALVAAAVAFAPGCKQGEGERCEIQRDCQDGLTCTTLDPSADGICTDPNKVQPVPDAAVEAAEESKPVVDLAGEPAATD